MDKNGIDDLLKVVSPELVTGYVARNFTAGSSLHAVNEEYKAASQRKGIDYWFKLTMFSCLVGFVLGMYLLYRGLPTYIALLSLFAMTIPPFLCLTWVGRKFEKDRETRYRCEPILRDFNQAVEALRPVEDVLAAFFYIAHSYSESTVKHVLTVLAATLLDAEEKFKKERMREKASTDSVVASGLDELKRRKLYESTIKAAERFGIGFKEKELFRDAENIRSLNN